MDDRTQSKTNLQDLRTHLQKLDQAKLLRRVTIPINKDTELMPLVRWQFRGLKEAEWAVKGDYHKTGERAAKDRKPAGK